MMPFYPYKCTKCLKEDDVYFTKNAASTIPCTFDGCDGTMTRILAATIPPVFKGTGFHATDYKDKK